MTRAVRTLTVGLLLGCGGLESSIRQELRELTAVQLAPNALNVGVGETYQFTATPMGEAGDPLPGLTPIFRSTDTLKVKVSASGLVTGIAVGSANVIAKVQTDEFTRADTTVVTVTAAPVTLGSFTLDPETMILGANETRQLTVTVTNSSGTDVSGFRPFYVSLTPQRATVNENGEISGVSSGTTKIIGTIRSGTVTLMDTVDVTVTYPTFTTVYMAGSFADRNGFFYPPIVTIAPGGTVSWFNYDWYSGEQKYSITFDDPSNVIGGDVPVFEGEGPVERTFPVAGVYNYHSTTNPATGIVVVK